MRLAIHTAQPNPRGQLTAIQRPQQPADRGQRRLLLSGRMDPGPDPDTSRRGRHHRITDPTQPRTPSHHHILTATTDTHADRHTKTAHHRAVSLTTAHYPASSCQPFFGLTVRLSRRP